jgi:hypothetical protein
MVDELKLNAMDAGERLSPGALEESAIENGIDYCVLLPTASPENIVSINDRFIRYSNLYSRLRTFATLHPQMEGLQREAERVLHLGVLGFKFSSFSQRFGPDSPGTMSMLACLERIAAMRSKPLTVTFDTFFKADLHFNARPEHITTPERLAALVDRHPGIQFIAAHMGGLLADYDDIRRYLFPRPNLYLDTSNAAHTLTKSQFIELVKIHGPSRVLFGTDWPWFRHEPEMRIMEGLLGSLNAQEVITCNDRELFEP